MNLKSQILASLIAALAAGAASAAPTFTVPGGAALDPFGGIDWASNGTVFSTDFDQTAANSGRPFSFSTTYFAYANPGSGIQRPDGTSFFVPNLQGGQAAQGANAFELTTLTTINETGSCSAGGTTCSFAITGGRFDVYLDTNVNSRVGAQAALSQYSDGTRILGGTITGGDTGFATSANVPGAGSGRTSIAGVVDFTNASFISPALAGTTATATLQLGAFQTNYVAPTGVVGSTGFCGTNGSGVNPRACAVIFQADANQSFTVGATPVPLPGTLALMGVALAGLGATARRRTAR